MLARSMSWTSSIAAPVLGTVKKRVFSSVGLYSSETCRVAAQRRNERLDEAGERKSGWRNRRRLEKQNRVRETDGERLRTHAAVESCNGHSGVDSTVTEAVGAAAADHMTTGNATQSMCV
eukprot:2096515-Rhodomonas_salina.1